MFERFTEEARNVMARARQQAQRFGHNCIKTEHIFLGLLKEDDCTGAKILKDRGVDTKKIRRELKQSLKPKVEPDPDAENKLPPTELSAHVVQYALEEARALKHDHIGTEHLLLGLLRETDGVAAQTLANLSIKLEDVRDSLA
jgi:ATP-dependent Clp protease ATP-binding subunit ClpC